MTDRPRAGAIDGHPTDVAAGVDPSHAAALCGNSEQPPRPVRHPGAASVRRNRPGLRRPAVVEERIPTRSRQTDPPRHPVIAAAHLEEGAPVAIEHPHGAAARGDVRGIGVGRDGPGDVRAAAVDSGDRARPVVAHPQHAVAGRHPDRRAAHA